MKESNEEIRKYILKYIKPINVKLNKHEYRNYPEFEKEVSGMFDRVTKEGPKLSGFKLIYTEAHRKLSSQGAEFLFRDFSKQQEKEKEKNKDL